MDHGEQPSSSIGAWHDEMDEAAFVPSLILLSTPDLCCSQDALALKDAAMKEIQSVFGVTPRLNKPESQEPLPERDLVSQKPLSI